MKYNYILMLLNTISGNHVDDQDVTNVKQSLESIRQSAVSLNTTINKLERKIMQINPKYNIESFYENIHHSNAPLVVETFGEISTPKYIDTINDDVAIEEPIASTSTNLLPTPNLSPKRQYIAKKKIKMSDIPSRTSSPDKTSEASSSSSTTSSSSSSSASKLSEANSKTRRTTVRKKDDIEEDKSIYAKVFPGSGRSVRETSYISTDNDDQQVSALRVKRKRKKYSSRTTSAVNSPAQVISGEEQTPTTVETPQVLTNENISEPMIITDVDEDVATLSANSTDQTRTPAMIKANLLDNIERHGTIPEYLMLLDRVLPSDIGLSLLTCEPNNMFTLPNKNNFQNTIKYIERINLSEMSNRIYFYEMLEPLAYYGKTTLSQDLCLSFITKASQYYVMCSDNYNEIRKQMSNYSDADRMSLFVIHYNFLWFYKQFIRTLREDFLTLCRNQKLENYIRLNDNFIQKTFIKIQLPAPTVKTNRATSIMLMALMRGAVVK